MISSFRILLDIFIKPFYRENIGSLLFFYTVMILAVGHLDGEGTIYYHTKLIIGMLENADTFIIVCFAWLLYMLKCLRFVTRALQKPDNKFLYVINCLPRAQRFCMSVLVMIIIFVPIGWYGLLIIGVGWYTHYYYGAILLAIYLIVLCLVPAAWIVNRMKYPGTIVFGHSKFPGLIMRYPGVLIRFVAEQQKILFITIKLFSCALLYGFTRINIPDAYDVQFPFLFFSLAILSNGIIVHRVRTFEEVFMVSYRGAPVSIFRRLTDYFIFYGVVLIPELITIVALMPVHLHFDDAIRFALTGYGLLMLLNSICFLEDFTMNEYLRVMLVVLCIQYFFVVSDSLTGLYITYLVLAVFLFYRNYYFFEKKPKPGID